MARWQRQWKKSRVERNPKWARSIGSARVAATLGYLRPSPSLELAVALGAAPEATSSLKDFPLKHKRRTKGKTSLYIKEIAIKRLKAFRRTGVVYRCSEEHYLGHTKVFTSRIFNDSETSVMVAEDRGHVQDVGCVPLITSSQNLNINPEGNDPCFPLLHYV